MRLADWAKKSPLFTISIHAPIRGATSLALLKKGIKTISIHAPIRGATLLRTTQQS
ncbi:hypothetical protein bpmyx0001_51720 [Bacillus pseudomycoides DSM 12442]|nr:hypothetical protein bpmyx0001_51720 [Bacillus pseudomycoides DSM 12442]